MFVTLKVCLFFCGRCVYYIVHTSIEIISVSPLDGGFFTPLAFINTRVFSVNWNTVSAVESRAGAQKYIVINFEE